LEEKKEKTTKTRGKLNKTGGNNKNHQEQRNWQADSTKEEERRGLCEEDSRETQANWKHR
jgi:hypothetical protein